MSYTKTEWLDHIKSSAAVNINKNSDGTYDISSAGEVIQQGTPMSAENFNHIEQGIYDAHKNIENVKGGVALNRSTLGTQRKNLLKNTGTSKTMYGVSFTVNDDMSVTANGTNNAQNNSNFFVFSDTLQPGRYILTGCPNGGGTVYQMRVGKGTGDGEYVGHDKGAGLSFTVSETDNYTVMCQISPGQTADNVTFYPMLRDADITDDTYEQYLPSIDTRLSTLEKADALNNYLPKTGGAVSGDLTVNGIFKSSTSGQLLYSGTISETSGSITIENIWNYNALLFVFENMNYNSSGRYQSISVVVPMQYVNEAATFNARGNIINGTGSFAIASGSNMSMPTSFSGYVSFNKESTANTIRLSSQSVLGSVKVYSII